MAKISHTKEEGGLRDNEEKSEESVVSLWYYKRNARKTERSLQRIPEMWEISEANTSKTWWKLSKIQKIMQNLENWAKFEKRRWNLDENLRSV